VISFRTHVVTLVAVFLALAVGVVLGGGPLSEVGRGDGDGSGTARLETAAAESRRTADYAERFAGAAAASLYAGRLAEREVALVVLPGAEDDEVEALQEQVTAAGGTVTVTQTVGEPLVNPSEKSLVDTLGSQLADQLPEDAVAADATTYERMGQLLGYTLATTDAEGAGTSAQSRAVLDGVRGADLVEGAEAGERRAPLVLVVLGDEVDGEGGDDILGGLVRGLSRAALGVVVAGESSDGEDQLGRLREGDALVGTTSVDGIETVPGRVAAVLGLARSFTVRGGAFGASGSDGPLPLG